MKKAPCIKCEKKGCGSYHDECPLYLEFKKENEAEYKLRRKEKDKKDWVYRSVLRNKKRSNKRNGQ